MLVNKRLLTEYSFPAKSEILQYAAYGSLVLAKRPETVHRSSVVTLVPRSARAPASPARHFDDVLLLYFRDFDYHISS